MFRMVHARTSASRRSANRSSVTLLSTVEGPPTTCTPVYKAVVVEPRVRNRRSVQHGPRQAMINSWTFSTPIRRVAAHNSRACRNCIHELLGAAVDGPHEDQVEARPRQLPVHQPTVRAELREVFGREADAGVRAAKHTVFVEPLAQGARPLQSSCTGSACSRRRRPSLACGSPRRRGEPCNRAEAARSAARLRARSVPPSQFAFCACKKLKRRSSICVHAVRESGGCDSESQRPCFLRASGL